MNELNTTDRLKALQIIVESIVGGGEDLANYPPETMLYGDMHAEGENIKQMLLNLKSAFAIDNYTEEDIVALRELDVTIDDVLTMLGEHLMW